MSFSLHVLLALFLVVTLMQSCGDRKDNANNRLKNSGSPYLREHADNPVDWYEWSPEALQKAKDENKPLIISIGYAACHWCHVMEEETFMDSAVAKFMNDNFVSIKIDREERPDIDQIYLDAAQLISGNSGWPLNAFALPDGKPFYAGTYFPTDGWQKLLEQIISAYKNDYGNVVKQADALTNGIRANQTISFSDTILIQNQETFKDIFSNWESNFDYERGGLKGAPKFPLPVVWEFLLQHHHLTGEEKSLDLVTTTLDGILQGGVYDVLAGGFARYSVGDDWRVPHFEKMLYDNGQLVSLYSHAYQVTGKPSYKEAVERTLQFVERTMMSADGGFFSSLNADSEGEEGKFYAWTKSEIQNTLHVNSSDIFYEFYNISDSGNWEHGKNILYANDSRETFAAKKKISLQTLSTILAKAESQLIERRLTRVPPSLDDKILVSWNALMLQGYIDAYLALGKDAYLQTALTNADFLVKNLLQSNGSLMRNYKDGRPSIDAFLEDYALLARAFIHLYQATFDIEWLEKAKSMTEYAVAHFLDRDTGLFFYTPAHAEGLIMRRIETADNVIPASNSVLAEVLFMLGEYYSNDDYITRSQLMLNKVAPAFTTGGPSYANWARLMGMVVHQPYEVAIMGKDASNKSKEMQSHYNPTALFMGGVAENLPLLQNKLVENRTMIYVCRNKVCKSPEEIPSKALLQMKRSQHANRL